MENSLRFGGTPLSTNPDLYTNINELQSINRLADTDEKQALKKLAQQFESIFLNIMLKTARQTNDLLAKDNAFASNEMSFRKEMFDNQLALVLSETGQIGLAEQFYRQLTGESPVRQPSSPEIAPVYKVDRTDKLKVPPFADDQQSFVEKILPYAKKAAGLLGIQPQVLIAQAALETGWGEHVIATEEGKSSLNLFNIKAGSNWNGESVRVKTTEVEDGVLVKENADFRRYDDLEQGFTDYVNFVSQPRYANALAATNEQDYIQALADSGYATDPDYATKIRRLMNNDVIQNAVNGEN